MNTINERHSDYLKIKQSKAECNLEIKRKNDSLLSLNNEMTELSLSISEHERSLSNAKKGMGTGLSSDELITLKKALESNQIRLSDLLEITAIEKQSLANSKSANMNFSLSARHLVNDLSQLIAENSASDLVIDSPKKLKELALIELSAQGMSFKGRPDDYDEVYRAMGKKIFEKLFTEGSPTIEQAMEERDLLIENLA